MTPAAGAATAAGEPVAEGPGDEVVPAPASATAAAEPVKGRPEAPVAAAPETADPAVVEAPREAKIEPAGAQIRSEAVAPQVVDPVVGNNEVSAGPGDEVVPAPASATAAAEPVKGRPEASVVSAPETAEPAVVEALREGEIEPAGAQIRSEAVAPQVVDPVVGNNEVSAASTAAELGIELPAWFTPERFAAALAETRRKTDEILNSE